MLDFRLKSPATFNKMHMQEWGPDLSDIDFENLTYYKKSSNEPTRDWEDVPEKIKETFERLGIRAARAKISSRSFGSV